MAEETDFPSEDRRFEFGKNWLAYSATINRRRIEIAQASLTDMLNLENLSGMDFLDVGCGSGLFSLAAVLLGARRVHSFDYDLNSVICTREVKKAFARDTTNWSIERGDILHAGYINAMKTFDVVYAWGSLHHTGDMWKALEHAVIPVRKDGGRLFVAIYNDAGIACRAWRAVKRVYVHLPSFCRTPYALLFAPVLDWRMWASNVFSGRAPWQHWRDVKKERGMSYWYEIKDWIGGYPYEFARPEEIFDFYVKRGFRLDRLTTAGGYHGNNQFVFTRM